MLKYNVKVLCSLNTIWFLKNHNFFLFQKNIYMKYISIRLKKFFLTGLGCKILLRRNILYFLLGFSHYIILSLPSCIKIVTRKKRVYFIAIKGIT